MASYAHTRTPLMFALSPADEAALLAMLEGRHSPADLARMQDVYGRLHDRRCARQGIERAVRGGEKEKR